ncbi:MAG: hypothetical protein ABFC84_04890 [Veillonellales bacterium]
MKKRFPVFLCILTLFLVFSLPGTALAAAAVETVSVSITAGSDSPLPPLIAKRMANSVSTVGQQVLIGRKVADIADGRSSYEGIIKEVFDRILVGYSVDQVEITPGVETHIDVTLAPWGEIVKAVELEIDSTGMQPAVAELVRQDLGDIQGKVTDVLIGLPIDAVDWAGGVSKTVIRDLVADRLPEFRANIDVASGPKTVVRISLVPQGAMIQDVHVSLRSHTIPNVLLAQARPSLDEFAVMLRGLPVSFVERHRDIFTTRLTAAAAASSITRRYGITLTPVLQPAADTEVMLDAETTRYKVTLEGYLDMGRATDNTSVRLHGGKFTDARNELFVETDFFPSSVTWKIMPGWSHRVGASTFIGFKYNLTDDRNIVFINQSLPDNWSLRLERTPVTDLDEVGLRYRFHDFLSVEYVFTNKDKWLRLVAEL